MPTDPRHILAVGIFGAKSRIGDRIEFLLRRNRALSPTASAHTIAVSTFSLTVLLLAASFTPRWIAFAQQPALFSVVSIHRNTSGSEGSIVNLPDTGRLTVTNASLKTLLLNAYGVQNDQIAGGPKWFDSEKYDIRANTDGPISEYQEEPLLQTMLTDRFQLKTHWETRDFPIYVLTSADSGPKFKENTGIDGSMATSRAARKIRITVTRQPVGKLTSILGKQLGRVVEDKTGLKGYYDFTLEWDPDQTPESTAPSVFAALEEQLGLKLRAARGPVKVLVIDRAEHPYAN